MKQLELFPGDEIRFAMSFTSEQFRKIKDTIPESAFARLSDVRQAVHRWNYDCDMADRKYRSALYEVGIDW